MTPKPDRPSRRARSAGVLRPSAWSSSSRRRRPGGRFDGRGTGTTGRTGAVSSCGQGQIRSSSRPRRSTSRRSRPGSTVATGPSQCRASGSNRQTPPVRSARTKNAASKSVPRWPSSSLAPGEQPPFDQGLTDPGARAVEPEQFRPLPGVIRPQPVSSSARPGARGESAWATWPSTRCRLPSGPRRAPVARRAASRPRASPGVCGGAGGRTAAGAAVIRATGRWSAGGGGGPSGVLAETRWPRWASRSPQHQFLGERLEAVAGGGEVALGTVEPEVEDEAAVEDGVDEADEVVAAAGGDDDVL